MCLIAHRPVSKKKGKGSNIPNDVIESNLRRNPDGFGLAWREKGDLRYEKYAPDDWADFVAALKDVDAEQDLEYAAHWRLATHGAPCLELSHPFAYADKKEGDILVFHNGIIPLTPPKGESDTRHFVNTVLTRLPTRWWADHGLKYLVEEGIGYSRLLVMSPSGETIYLNRKQWVEKGGLLYSTTPIASPTNYTTGQYSYRSHSDYQNLWGGDDDDKEDEDALLPAAGAGFTVRRVEDGVPAASGKGWYARVGNGATHYVKAVGMETDNEGDTFGTGECVACGTKGEVYVIGGKVYLDVAHKVKSSDESRALVKVN